MTLPLWCRVPNPPAFFVGREAELARLEAVLERGHAALVAGPAGVGKSALVAQLVDRLAPERALFVSVGARDGSGVYRPLLRALAQAIDLPAADVFASASTDEDRLTRAIDLADAAADVVVVEDLHHDPEGARLAEAAAAHARRARWLFTGQAGAEDDHLFTLRLGPLDAATARELAARLAPQATPRDRARAVRRSAGLPGALGRALSHGGLSGGPEESPLTAEERAALGLLGHLVRPVRPAALPIQREVLRALEARGLLLMRGGGVVLPEAAGPRAAPLPLDSPQLEPLLEALAGDPEAALEAIRLRLARAEVAAGRALLDDHGPRLLDEGFTRELRAALEQAPASAEPAIAAWRLRVLAEDGDPAALASLDPPPADADVPTRFAYLKARYALEDRGCVPLADEVAEAAARAGDEERACEAAFMAASLEMLRGRLDEAEQRLARARPANASQALHRLAVQAMIAGQRGDRSSAQAIAARLEADLPSLRGHARASLGYNLGVILYGLGEPYRAARLFASLFPEDELATSALVSRRALELDAHLTVLSGNLPRARRVLARLRRIVPAGTPIDARSALIGTTVDLLQGDYEACERALRRGLALAEGYGGVEDTSFALKRAAQLAWRRDAAPTHHAGALPLGDAARAWIHLATLARHGAAPPWAASPDPSPELADLETLIAAVEARIAGNAAPARGAPLPIDPSRPMPHRLLTGGLAAQLRVTGGMTAAEAPALDELRALAEQADAAPLATELARFAAAAAGDAAPTIEAFRAGEPLATRVVCGPAEDDGWLRATLATALRARLGWATSFGPAARDALVVDAPRAEVHGPGGARVGTRAGAIGLSLLRALSARPAGADKETLSREVWGGPDYHPLRHDNRLRVAVRKLRRWLAPLVGEDALVRTLEDGYALAHPVIWSGPAPD